MEIEFCLMLIFEILIIHKHEVPHKNRFSRHDVYWTQTNNFRLAKYKNRYFKWRERNVSV